MGLILGSDAGRGSRRRGWPAGTSTKAIRMPPGSSIEILVRPLAPSLPAERVRGREYRRLHQEDAHACLLTPGGFRPRQERGPLLSSSWTGARWRRRRRTGRSRLGARRASWAPGCRTSRRFPRRGWRGSAASRLVRGDAVDPDAAVLQGLGQGVGKPRMAPLVAA